MIYNIIINEYQRGLLMEALKALSLDGMEKLPGGRSEPGFCGGKENRKEEFQMLTELFDNLPDSERQDPGVTHGFCF